MKNVKRILFALLLIVGINKVSAIEYNYSEWSTLYPSGMDELLIQSEVRYKWYTFENNLIVYTDDYYTEYDGYTKDEASAKTFYRYITNDRVFMNKYNQLVTDNSFCEKNFCYIRILTEPTMVDLSEKEENLYENAELKEYTPEVVPKTLDAIYYSFGLIIISLIGILLYIIRKRKKEIFN